MARHRIENGCRVYCCSILALAGSITMRLLAVEMTSLVYGIWIFTNTANAWLALAKYHGFAINICLGLILMSVLPNLTSFISDYRSRTVRFIRVIYRRLILLQMTIFRCAGGMPQRRMHSHAFYSYRLFFSSFMHTLVHVLKTHTLDISDFTCFRRTYRGAFSRLFGMSLLPINHRCLRHFSNTSLPSRFSTIMNVHHQSTPNAYNSTEHNDNKITAINVTSITHNTSDFIYFLDFAETLLVYDRWTVTGYLLLLFFIVELSLGLRLMRFLAKHVYVLLAHRIIGTLIIFMLLSAHHTNYTFIALPALLFIVDYLIGVYLLTYSVKVRSVLIYPSSASIAPSPGDSHNDDVFEIDFDVISDRFASTCKPGDYISVKIPQISRWQWHKFTIMKYSGDNDDEIGSSRYNARGIAIVRRKILVRCVGQWTNAVLKHPDNNLDMVIKGPYRSDQACFITDLLSRPLDRLVLMSTGTSITHHLSLLNGLIDEYWLRETTAIATDGFDAHHVPYNTPREIRLVWIIRRSTDVNFAIRTLNNMQLLLAKRGMDGLLVYDIWVTREPTLNELELNTRLQTYLSSPLMKGNAYRNTNSSSIYEQGTVITRSHYHNRILSLHHGLNDVSRQFSFSLNYNDRSQLPGDKSLSPSTSIFSPCCSSNNSASDRLFEFFYTNAEMHTGVRPSWNKLRTMCTKDSASDNPYHSRALLSSMAEQTAYPAINPNATLVLLSTSVERLRLDIEQLAISNGFELFAEDLWS